MLQEGNTTNWCVLSNDAVIGEREGPVSDLRDDKKEKTDAVYKDAIYGFALQPSKREYLINRNI